MIMQPKAIRAFECTEPVEIFRIAGRRPTDVWVDSSGSISGPGPTNQRLKELVYWRTVTQTGEQIQERVGGLFLVPLDGTCHPIVLSPPQPIGPKTAFLHAQTARNDDASLIESLIESGKLVQVPGHRVQHHTSRPSDRLVPAEHALIVDERPAELDDAPSPPVRRAWSGRS